MVDREIALKTVARACLKLATGREVRLDKNVVLSAFPIVVDDRPLETRIVEFLRGAAAGANFRCQRIANGDFVVARSTADAPQKPTGEPPPRQPQPAKPRNKQERASNKRAPKPREPKRAGARRKQASKPKR